MKANEMNDDLVAELLYALQKTGKCSVSSRLAGLKLHPVWDVRGGKVIGSTLAYPQEVEKFLERFPFPVKIYPSYWENHILLVKED